MEDIKEGVGGCGGVFYLEPYHCSAKVFNRDLEGKKEENTQRRREGALSTSLQRIIAQ